MDLTKDVPRSHYWIVTTCPLCGSRVRGNRVMRHWEAQPEPAYDDAEFMVCESSGHRRLNNLRGPLLDLLDTPQRTDTYYQMKRRLYTYFDRLEKRAYKTANAAYRIKGRFL